MKNVKFKLRTARAQFFLLSFFILPFAFFLSGCASYDAGGNVQRGRYALLRGDSRQALGYFQAASQVDPNYTYRIGPMKEGVFTYVGRAHYDSGDIKAAQNALEQARQRHPDDYFAPLYLGLTLSKDGDRPRGAKELQTGLTGLHDWLDYIDRNSVDKAYWDPGAYIRSGIREQLARIDSREINWPELIAGAERVGRELEEEADQVNTWKRRDQRDSAKGDRGN